jgi:hypothetical protein
MQIAGKQIDAQAFGASDRVMGDNYAQLPGDGVFGNY